MQRLTFTDGDFHKANENKWQIGFYEREGVTFAGIFRNLMTHDNEVNAFGPETCLYANDDIDLEVKCIKSILGDNATNIYMYILPDLDWVDNQKRPETISILNWLIMKRTEKIQSIVKVGLEKKGIRFVSKIDPNTWYIGIGLGNSIDLVQKYYSRLGVNPDEEPDILLTAKRKFKDEDDFLHSLNFSFIKRMCFKDFHDMSFEDFNEWKKIFKSFNEVFFAIDGYLFYASAQKNKTDILKALEPVAKQCNLKIAQNLVLY